MGAGIRAGDRRTVTDAPPTLGRSTRGRLERHCDLRAARDERGVWFHLALCAQHVSAAREVLSACQRVAIKHRKLLSAEHQARWAVESEDCVPRGNCLLRIRGTDNSQIG